METINSAENACHSQIPILFGALKNYTAHTLQLHIDLEVARVREREREHVCE